MSRICRLIPLVLALACSGAARAQDSASKIITATDIQAAQLLILSNHLDEAKLLLQHSLAARPDDKETLSLLATIAVEEKDYDGAISLYRRILVREPNAERVRLDPARIRSEKKFQTVTTKWRLPAALKEKSRINQGGRKVIASPPWYSSFASTTARGSSRATKDV